MSDADPKPLSDALRKIGDIVEHFGTWEPALMNDALTEIIDTAKKGKSEYIENVRSAKQAEIDRLRAQVAPPQTRDGE